MKKYLFSLFVICITTICNAQKQPTLKEAYGDYFDMGVALSTEDYKEAKASTVIVQQFGSITAENCMKPHQLAPRKGVYNFAPADQLVDYAIANGLRVRGHALLWHSAAPDWFFAPEGGKPATKEVIYGRLRSYIHTVVKHFKGRVYCWDVVNEAISDRRNGYHRTRSKWYEACGDAEFIEKAFIYAREADPDIKLFYNDYNVVDPVKRAKIIRMVAEMKAKGVPIDGIGIQAHWNIVYPTAYQLDCTLAQIATLGLDIHITELDVRVTVKEHGGQLDGDRSAHAIYDLTPELVAQQEQQYEMIFETLRKYRKEIQSVTFWNLHDGNTWLDLRRNNIGKNFPLLFDEQIEPKSSYYKVTQF